MTKGILDWAFAFFLFGWGFCGFAYAASALYVVWRWMQGDEEDGDE